MQTSWNHLIPVHGESDLVNTPLRNVTYAIKLVVDRVEKESNPPVSDGNRTVLDDKIFELPQLLVPFCPSKNGWVADYDNDKKDPGKDPNKNQAFACECGQDASLTQKFLKDLHIGPDSTSQKDGYLKERNEVCIAVSLLRNRTIHPFNLVPANQE